MKEKLLKMKNKEFAYECIRLLINKGKTEIATSFVMIGITVFTAIREQILWSGC